MASRRASKRRQLEEYLAEKQPARIGEVEWEEIRCRLAPTSERYLRELVRACGLPLDPVVEGVRQDSLEELERTLTALAREYGEAVRQGGRERAQRVRQLVLTSKAHTRLAAQNPRLTPAKRAEKKEALLWLTTWLENPELFPVWVDLRKEKLPPRELT